MLSLCSVIALYVHQHFLNVFVVGSIWISLVKMNESRPFVVFLLESKFGTNTPTADDHLRLHLISVNVFSLLVFSRKRVGDSEYNYFVR